MAVILIIDDSASYRERIGTLVHREGYEVLKARDGLEGLQMITSHTPDCIIMDLLMPKMGGMELLKVMNEKGCNIPVIVITANIQGGVREQCLGLGAWGFIEKPPKRNELKSAIIKALDTKEGT